MKKNKITAGFTFIEILAGVAIIGFISTVVFVTVDPGRRFAESRDSRRIRDIDTIADAISLHAVDNGGQLSASIPGTYIMLGTATDGCAVGCEYLADAGFDSPHVEPDAASGFLAQGLRLVPEAKALELGSQPQVIGVGPKLSQAQALPVKVVPGDEQVFRVVVEDSEGVAEVSADIAGIENISLSLVEGDEYYGVWEGMWTVHNTIDQLYATVLTAQNSRGETNTTTIYWRDPPVTGWILPTGFVDSGSQWVTETDAFDDNIGTYASNQYGGTGWGEFIEFTLPTATTSDRVRVNADYNDGIIQEVDVDVFKDGAWEDVFLGGDEATWNGQYVELPFTKGDVSSARFRFNYLSGGFFYWVYEFQFYQAVDVVSVPTCSTSSVLTLRANLASIQGSVGDDGGEPVEYRFEYGLTPSFGNSTPWTSSKVTGETFSEVIDNLFENTTYYFRGEIRNSAGTVFCPTESFTTIEEGVGWVYPSSTGSSGAWEDVFNAYDDSLDTYARSYHDINDPQWSEFIVFEHPAMLVDSVRLKGLGGSLVSQVDVDLFIDGGWQDLYEGSFPDQQLFELLFTESLVSDARVRFFATNANTGFFWQLYDFTYNKVEESGLAVYEDACLDLSTELEPYLKDIPQDPRLGSEERTYYLVKKDVNNILTVAACAVEEAVEVQINQ